MSVGAIPESEIGWFFYNRGMRPTAHELMLIARLDGLMLTSLHAKNSKD